MKSIKEILEKNGFGLAGPDSRIYNSKPRVIFMNRRAPSKKTQPDDLASSIRELGDLQNLPEDPAEMFRKAALSTKHDDDEPSH